MAADTIDWISPVSGMQHTRSPRTQASGQPSHSLWSRPVHQCKKAPALDGEAEDEVEEEEEAVHVVEAPPAGKEVPPL